MTVIWLLSDRTTQKFVCSLVNLYQLEFAPICKLVFRDTQPIRCTTHLNFWHLVCCALQVVSTVLLLLDMHEVLGHQGICGLYMHLMSTTHKPFLACLHVLCVIVN